APAPTNRPGRHHVPFRGRSRFGYLPRYSAVTLLTQASQGPRVQDANRSLAATHTLGEDGIGQFLDMASQEHLLHVRRQARKSIGSTLPRDWPGHWVSRTGSPATG